MGKSLVEVWDGEPHGHTAVVGVAASRAEAIRVARASGYRVRSERAGGLIALRGDVGGQAWCVSVYGAPRLRDGGAS